MVTIQVPCLPILDSIEDYLAEGTNATEFRETVNRAAETFYQSEAHNYKNVAYAWRSGQEFLRIKDMVRRGRWTAWKDHCGFASARKIEMYMKIARGFESEEVASAAAPTIVAADAFIRRRKSKV